LQSRLTDDRTDDCAFGAMMSLALRPQVRKLRFQMIADTRFGSTYRRSVKNPEILNQDGEERRVHVRAPISRLRELSIHLQLQLIRLKKKARIATRKERMIWSTKASF